MFINFSNHPSDKWDDNQLREARKWGEILDIPFPAVPAAADEAEVAALADEKLRQILAEKPDAVLCQGEFTLTYAVVEHLLEAGITVVAACSERVSEERQEADGHVEKVSVFRFQQFRRYGTVGAAN